ncbi:hypothetical protein BDQ12DRAFT_723866 [Crucibulum laeve]|uniref:Uncharacterized protein n=1 Tax=Crucibulum laeve TaxID=68775 RepID=A0A5C3M9G7_9AGAR|nr:hypothetical protein BDQ12DRAFT_723866 [Crucibulum laeve]
MLAEMQEQAACHHQEVMDILSSKQAALPPGMTLNDLRCGSSSLSLLIVSTQTPMNDVMTDHTHQA